MWNLATNQSQVVGQHDAPIRHIFFVPDMSNMLVTASWDRSIRYWDMRQPKPAHQQPMAERIYAMDIRQAFSYRASARLSLHCVFSLVDVLDFLYMLLIISVHHSNLMEIRQALGD